MTRISIDPITRLEGHGKIEIFLDAAGGVEKTYFQIPELRGFERFAVGRPVEDMPQITSRICGVCPEAHHTAAVKAADEVYHVTPPRPARLLRELLYSAFFCTDHTTHFYALAGPDFLLGPDTPVAERNLLGVIHAVGSELAGQVITMRKYGHSVIEIIGGRKIHPVTGVPGGMSHPITEEQRLEIERMGRWAVEFARMSLNLFHDKILPGPFFRDLISSDTYTHHTYSIGMVDENNRVNFYDGKISVVDPDGVRVGKFAPREYTEWIAERIEPWTYLKFPYLKKIGWKGFVDGKDSGVYTATPLARLNAADGMATPLAQAEYERFFAELGGKPVHQRMAMHWARLIELLYAAERWVELAGDPEVTSDAIRTLPTETPTEGVGMVEAPRGTLIHHYTTDAKGIVTSANLLVGTTNNYAAMAMSVDKAAKVLIQPQDGWNERKLNSIEMAFRAYDPCFGCATHNLPGNYPVNYRIYNHLGSILFRTD